jgi:hypothetical protein
MHRFRSHNIPALPMRSIRIHRSIHRSHRIALVGLILLLGSLTVHPSRAGAVPPVGDCVVPEGGWGLDCSDPTLTLNGTAIHLAVGVPREQAHLVERVTLEVVVPANARAQLTGTNAARGIGSLPIQTRLLHSGAPFTGSGPQPVTATATVHLRPGVTSDVAAGLFAWQAGVGAVGQTTGPAGSALSLTFAVR